MLVQPVVCLMQNLNDDYLQQLETVIITKLLPAYLQNCERLGIVPDLNDLPNSIIRRSKLKDNLPLLLKPFQKSV